MSERLIVYYDGGCPRCIRDRARFERLAGAGARDVAWWDIASESSGLQARGVDPDHALLELHVEDADGTIHAGLDAYRLLIRRIPWLRPLGWLIALPGVREGLTAAYRASVRRRLARQGRLPH